MFCTNCGAQIPDGARFCTSCGAAQGDAPRQPEPQPAPEPMPVPQPELQPVPAPEPVQQPTSVIPPRAVAPQPAAPSRTARPPRRGGGSGSGIVAVAAVLVVLAICSVVVCAGVMTDWFGLASPTQGQTPDPGQVDEDGEKNGEAGGEDTGSDSSGDTADEAGAPEVRSAVADYSWEELSQISRLISTAGSTDAALDVAREYHLCTDDGRLDGTQTKSLVLSDGTSVTMQVAGFNHDALADGSGAAGITFVSRGTVATRQMNASDTTAGGWRDSALRSWMNADLLGMLPADVSSVVVPVSKFTNAVGETTDASAVVATQDTLWTLSYVEIGGQMSTDDPGHDAVFNAEGTQYQLFSDMGVRWDAPNQILQIGGVENWWERTPDPMDGRYFMSVGEDGTPWYAHVPTKECGVVMCFCV